MRVTIRGQNEGKVLSSVARYMEKCGLIEHLEPLKTRQLNSHLAVRCFFRTGRWAAAPLAIAAGALKAEERGEGEAPASLSLLRRTLR